MDYEVSDLNPINPSQDSEKTQAIGSTEPDDLKQPDRIGRYRIEKLLGQGGFGLVYLALDEQLNRRVAIKVPHAKLISKPEDATLYLTEARTVASLDHPHVVPVFDVGSTSEFPCFIVSKYIQGTNLATFMRQRSFDFRQAADLLATVAEALHYAHKQGIVHRDVKPGNILIDEEGKPFVVDFGLALREENVGKGNRYAGTPAYMSPEQARGEGHRVDGRSDIFSLGVLFYEMLTNRKPFRGDSTAELLEQITSYEPRPLRQYNDRIPKELERVCLKAISKRATERYSTAKDLAEDLRVFLQDQTVVQSGITPQAAGSKSSETPVTNEVADKAKVTPVAGSDSTETQPIKIVPKGLRSFDAHDSDFFLELLPGARDREGLPDILRFWKNRIEEKDSDKTFSVGLLYGPSGCGKSSLVKAGLLPRLSENVVPIYVESTPVETEQRLLSGVRKHFPELNQSLGLKESLTALRLGHGIPPGKKITLILDQFEQWLHSNTQEKSTELTQALRQCDGGNVQCLLMVRDDFWMAITRFMRDLEVRLLENDNSTTVDLFPIRHAEKVLIAFGRALDCLPEKPNEMTENQISFIRQSVEGLAEDGKVICVRLALFAEMMKNKRWLPKTLTDVGGAQGIGATFLEETFSSKTSPPKYRYHQQAARVVLKHLLPETGTEIKGAMRTQAELLELSGYGSRLADFDDLLSILEREIRLITPSALEDRANGDDSLTQRPTSENSYYQLTHDYLVPSLREWITRKQRETTKGRAELKLAERAANWSSTKENKQLPTMNEWLLINYWTNKKQWTAMERSVMQTANLVHLRASGLTFLVILLLGLSLSYLFQQQNLRNQNEKIAVALDSLQNTLGPSAQVIIEKLLEMKRADVIRPELIRRYNSTKDSNEKLSLAFALASFGQVEADYLISKIDYLDYDDTANLINALSQDPRLSIEKLQQAANGCTTEALSRRKARLGLAALGVGDTNLPVDVCEFEGRPDHTCRTYFIDEFPRWRLDIEKLASLLNDMQSPALRSGVCLGLGQIPVKRIPASGKESIQELTTRWFHYPDSSTHNAVSWLLRRWEWAEPSISTTERVVDRRNWFVNSQGSTLIRIDPPLPQHQKFPDPLDLYRQRLAEIEKKPKDQQKDSGVSFQRAEALYHLGQYHEASIELNSLISDKRDPLFDKTAIEFLQTLCFARLGRGKDVEVARNELLTPDYVVLNSIDLVRPNRDLLYVPVKRNVRKPETFDYWESLQMLWLGRQEEAVKQLEHAIQALKPDDSGTCYNLACAAALFAASESNTTDRHKWLDNSLSLLERWSSGSNEDRSRMVADPDLISLHAETRFRKLVSAVPSESYWVARFEVSLREFDEFRKNSSFQESDLQKLASEKEEQSKSLFWDLSLSRRISGRNNIEDVVNRSLIQSSSSQDQISTPDKSIMDSYQEISPTRDHPAQGVSWFGAIMYCNWLSAKENRTPAYRTEGKEMVIWKNDQLLGHTVDKWILDKSANGYRLLSEMEWEYACRAGTDTVWSFGNDDLMLSGYCQAYPSKLSATCGAKLPNAWGLHDMHGNVFEWCWTRFSDGDGKGVFRGGGWSSSYAQSTSDSRFLTTPLDRGNNLGFRIAIGNPMKATPAEH